MAAHIAVAVRSTPCITVILHSKLRMSPNHNGFLFAQKYLQGGTSLFQFFCDGWLDERNHRPGVLRPPKRFRRPTAPERPLPIPLFDRKRPSRRPELPSGRAPRSGSHRCHRECGGTGGASAKRP